MTAGEESRGHPICCHCLFRLVLSCITVTICNHAGSEVFIYVVTLVEIFTSLRILFRQEIVWSNSVPWYSRIWVSTDQLVSYKVQFSLFTKFNENAAKYWNDLCKVGIFFSDLFEHVVCLLKALLGKELFRLQMTEVQWCVEEINGRYLGLLVIYFWLHNCRPIIILGSPQLFVLVIIKYRVPVDFKRTLHFTLNQILFLCQLTFHLANLLRCW